MPCFTKEQENVIKTIHFVTKLGKAKDNFEKELNTLYFKENASYSTKLSYAFYQHYTLWQTYSALDAPDTICLEILKIYDELLTGKDEDWFIECLKLMFYEQKYDGICDADVCTQSISRMLELQKLVGDNIPDYIITYILEAFFLFKRGETKKAVRALNEGLNICAKGNIRCVLHEHFKGFLERFLYQTHNCKEDGLSILLEKIADCYFSFGKFGR